ncbi:MAG TPA: hypothetical protein VGS27_15530 [Candidatus Sulfotelmatobacter sp.]|nr:hypothetical protein [Candidatus Sulfotelmatobacter sp.]
MRALALAALIFALSASLAAQRGGSFHFSGFGAHSNFAHAARSHFSRQHFDHRGTRGGDYGVGYFDPFWGDYFPPDYPQATEYPAASQPPVVVVQSSPTAPAAETPPTPAEPLTIELQGERYVRISGDDSSQAQMIDSPTPPKLVSHETASASPLSAVLIFRDGHREEVTGYTIADSRLYVTSNYLATGYWIQKIELSSLDLPGTIAANNVPGHRFQLPSSPNEVIVGP